MLKNIILFTAKALSVLIVLWWAAYIILSHGFSLITLLESIIPLTLLGTTIIAWNMNRIGGILLVLLGIIYLVFAWGVMDLQTYFFVSGPLIVAGVLFILADLISV